MTAFDAFPPTPVSLEIGGQALSITPIRVGELPALINAIQPFAHRLVDEEPDWLALLASHGDALITATALASRRPKDWVEGLALDEAIRLAAAVFEVNADFFVQRVVPAVQQATARVNSRLSGPTPCTASSDPGTASPT